MARRRDIANTDVSTYAAGELETVLRRQVAATTETVPTMTAAEAMSDQRVIEHDNVRDIVRVLFISTDVELLNPTQQTLDGYLELSDVFDEVHILLLRQGIAPRQPVFRPHKNVYMYTVSTERWWQLPLAGIKMVQSQLVFAEGFRADLVVARDPFESALVAQWIVRRFGCAAQLHILKNYFHPVIAQQHQLTWFSKLVLRVMTARFLSVRAGTVRLVKELQSRFSIPDVQQLPQFNPYEAIADQPQTLDLKQQYPQYVFTILFVGSLDQTGAVFQAIDAARYMLRNPKVAMIIVGDGAGKTECQKRVRILGIEKQVIFVNAVLNYDQYLLAADLLVVTNVDPPSEELVLRAAGAGMPMVMVRTERRDDVFTHRESAYMCEIEDIQAHSDGVHELMNDFSLRNQIKERAQQVVRDTFHQDQAAYSHEYRASIETALFVEPVANETSKDIKTTETEVAAT